MLQVQLFEQAIANYYNAPYAVATDCCTHAIELCLRLIKPKSVTCPNHTYLSIPMTFVKLNLNWNFVEEQWANYYYIGNTNIIDAAVYFKENSYIPNTLMCLSFQYKKHLNLGRGGMILCDNLEHQKLLKKLRYDGRLDDIPWADQNIDCIGYHYYMTPETAEIGLQKFNQVKNSLSKNWSYKDYPNLKNFKVFN